MKNTPVDLFRRGNASSPRMDNVRIDKDIAVFEENNIIWVKETVGKDMKSGGISTFSQKGTGKNCWKIDAGTKIPQDLELVNDRGNHWLWKPVQMMPLHQYKMA